MNRSSYSRYEKYCLPTNLKEMLAFFELLYLAGVKRVRKLNTDELWSTRSTELKIFLETMTKG